MTLVVTHAKTNSVVDTTADIDAGGILASDWNTNHTIAGTAGASQLSSLVPLTVSNDTNVTGSIDSQTLTLGWASTLSSGRLNSNVVQAVSNDTNVTGTIGTQTLTLGWTGTAAPTRGGTGIGTYTLGDTLYSDASNSLAKLAGNATSTKKFLRQTGTGLVSAAPAWDTIVAADVPGSALTKTDDTNVTLTLGGTPATALLNAASITAGWTGTLAAARLNANVVQSFTNDTNVTASVSSQVGQLGWTGSLSSTRGGTGNTSLTAHAVLIGNGASAVTFATASSAGRVLVDQGASADPAFKTISQDASLSSSGVLTVKGLQGLSVSSSTPTNNQSLTWSTATNLWAPATAGGTGTVSSIATGFGLTGGTITTTGTISVSSSAPAADAISAINCGLTISAAASALTIALKDQGGNDPSASSPVLVPFRSATGTTGTTSWLAVTGATSLVISSGSTLGVPSTTAFRLWIVGFNDAGTFRLGVINCLSGTTIYPLLAQGIASSTAEGGAGAADSAQVFYTDTAVTSKAYTVLAYIEWNPTGLTAGTWTTANLNLVQIWSSGMPLPNSIVQKKFASTTTQTDFTTASFADSALSLAFTLSSAANLTSIRVAGTGFAATAGKAGLLTVADGATDLAAYSFVFGSTSPMESGCSIELVYLANSTSAKTYKVRGRITSTTATFSWPVTEIGTWGTINIDEVMA